MHTVLVGIECCLYKGLTYRPATLCDTLYISVMVEIRTKRGFAPYQQIQTSPQSWFAPASIRENFFLKPLFIFHLCSKNSLIYLSFLRAVLPIITLCSQWDRQTCFMSVVLSVSTNSGNYPALVSPLVDRHGYKIFSLIEADVQHSDIRYSISLMKNLH